MPEMALFLPLDQAIDSADHFGTVVFHRQGAKSFQLSHAPVINLHNLSGLGLLRGLPPYLALIRSFPALRAGRLLLISTRAAWAPAHLPILRTLPLYGPVGNDCRLLGAGAPRRRGFLRFFPGIHRCIGSTLLGVWSHLARRGAPPGSFRLAHCP